MAEWLFNLTDYGVIGILLVLSTWAVAIAFERFAFYRKVNLSDYPSADVLETVLTRRLIIIGTIAVNVPYIGLLGTVFGIMLTFHTMGSTGTMDVKSIMVGLSLSLKSTAMGLLVAIPCVALNNMLHRHVKELVTAFRSQCGTQY